MRDLHSRTVLRVRSQIAFAALSGSEFSEYHSSFAVHSQAFSAMETVFVALI